MSEKPTPHGDTPRPDEIALWIRQRRKELGLSLGEVATALHVSSAFLSMIESGKKRPSVKKAKELATLLQEREGVLLKWIETYRPKSLEAARRTAREVEEFLAREENRGRSGRLEPQRPVERMRAEPGGDESVRTSTDLFSGTPPTSTLIDMPIVAEGSGPDEAPAGAIAAERSFVLDTALLAPSERLVHPFAYQLSEDAARRTRDVLRAGDIAIVSRDCWPLVDDEIYAVQLEEGIVLSRLLLRGDALLLLSSNPSSAGFELLPIADSAKTPEQLRGRVAVAIRRWR